MGRVICIILFQSIAVSINYAATITATVPGGEWTTGASWVGGAVPTNGDDVIIPNGSTITITDQTVNFNGTITIQSGGTLSFVATPFTNIARLTMDAASTITIDAGGQIISGGGSFLEGLNGITIGFNPIAYSPVINGSPYAGPATITQGGPVPVEIIFFDASSSNGKVELIWATATEENFDYFAIERSADGENFREIAQIPGLGESRERVDYQYTDEFPLRGKSYYRLRSIDFDGYTEIFEYKMVELRDLQEDFSVFPNPIINGQFALQTNFVEDEIIELIIYNNLGHVETRLPITDWLASFRVTGLRPGTYLFKLVTSNGVIVKRVLIK